MADDTFIKIGALWQTRDRSDQLMYRGSVTVKALCDWLDAVNIGGRRDDDRIPIVLLANNFKTEHTHPDFNLFGSDPDRNNKRSRFRRRDEPETAPRYRAPRDPEPEPQPKQRYTRKSVSTAKGRGATRGATKRASTPARGRGRLRLSR